MVRTSPVTPVATPFPLFLSLSFPRLIPTKFESHFIEFPAIQGNIQFSGSVLSHPQTEYSPRDFLQLKRLNYYFTVSISHMMFWKSSTREQLSPIYSFLTRGMYVYMYHSVHQWSIMVATIPPFSNSLIAPNFMSHSLLPHHSLTVYVW
jgi:hypothetical protein